MRTLNEIREVGLAVLSKTLGPADTVRFIQQYERGHGDYTAERDRLLGNPTVDELVNKIEQRRKPK
jgi:hypothetical protein